MAALIALDGATLGAGRTLRAALTLSAVSGQAFEMQKIRAGDARPGLRPEQTAVVRAAALCCQARLSGAFDGSPDLRFEPGTPAAGEYHFELPGAASAALVLQAVLPILAAAQSRSLVDVVGGTHVPGAPVFEFLARHWLPTVARLGLRAACRLERAGFRPSGEGRMRATAESWTRPASLDLTRRGALIALRGVSVSARVRGEVAQRQREACARRLWEERRLEVEWDAVEAKSARPGSYLYVEALFEHSRAAFAHLGQRGLGPEGLGERVARRLLLFLEEQADAAVDAHLAEQLVVPLALARGGGALTTPEVGPGLERVAAVVAAFGGRVRVDGRAGGPGRIEVDAC